MSITEHTLEGAKAEIGTLEDFGTMTFIERILTTELDDGREVEVFRGAFNPAYLEVKIEGEKKELRLHLNDMLQEAVRLLEKETSDATG